MKKRDKSPFYPFERSVLSFLEKRKIGGEFIRSALGTVLPLPFSSSESCLTMKLEWGDSEKGRKVSIIPF